MLSTLPPEVLLDILSFLPIYDIFSVQLVSRFFNDLVDTHSASVYRSLALFHGITSAEEIDVNELLKKRNIYLDWLKPSRMLNWRQPPTPLTSWKTYVLNHFILETSWSRGTSHEFRRRVNPTRPHRIQIDEEEGTLISTHGLRQIQVEDIMHEIPFWTQTTVPSWAHCEFDKGFLIWGRRSAQIEVWRRRKDQLLDPLPACSPDELQLGSERIAPGAELSDDELLAALRAEESTSDEAGCEKSELRDLEYRGQFTPFCVLTPPKVTSASRFVYPELVVVTRDATNAYIFNVPTARLVKTLELEALEDETVCYVDHSPTHVFICTTLTMSAYRKSDGQRDMRLTRDQLSPNHVYNAVVRPGERLCDLNMIQYLASEQDEAMYKEYLAVHVSPCGRIWVLIQEQKHLYICTGGFEGGEEPLEMTRIDLPDGELYYLAFDGKNIAVAGEMGIFTLSLKRLQNAGKPLSAIHKSISKSTLALNHPSGVRMQHTSCLQVTDTAIWHVGATDSRMVSSHRVTRAYFYF